MFNKISLKSLGILFGILLLIVVAFMIYDASHGERSFRKNLVSIDTSKVTEINIYPRSINHRKVKIYKDGREWKVELSKNQSAMVPGNKIQDLFSNLLEIKPTGVAASGEEFWKNYQVDTSGTRINVYQGNDKVLDMMIGKFAFERPRTMLSYVRVNGDDNVYITEGFLSYTFNHDANYFRNHYLINSEYTDWSKLTFTYPADSSFTLVKENNKWFLNGRPSDSAETVDYLRSVSQKTNSNFIDNPSESLLSRAECTLTIESKKMRPIIVSAYESPSQVVVNSSQNSGSFFDGKKNNFWHSIFVGKEHFFKKKKHKK